MYSRLIVALFAVLSLRVFSSPLPCDRDWSDSLSSTGAHNCSHHAHHTRSSLLAPSSAPTDDCSEPTAPSSTPIAPATPSTPIAPTTPSTPIISTTPPLPLDSGSPSTTPSSTPATPTTVVPPSTPSPTSSPAPTSSPVAVAANSSNGPFTGGVATYFYQGGNPGACGEYNSDSAMICAMDQARFGTSGPSSPLCGRKVRITNLNNGWSTTVTVADDCPTCDNANSIDLSVAAFTALEPDLSVGEFPISWEFE